MDKPESQEPKCIIGVLAGMGPRSTTPFLEAVLDQCQVQYGAVDDEDFPHIIIYSLPTPYVPGKKTSVATMRNCLKYGIDVMNNAGVDLLVVPCNTVHTHFEYMNGLSSSLMLNMVTESVKRIPDTNQRIAIVATSETVESEVYHHELTNQGYSPVNISEIQSNVDNLIQQIKSVRTNTQVIYQWRSIIEVIKEKDVETIVVACTDLSVLETYSVDSDILILNSGDILAEALVAKYCEMFAIESHR